MNDYDGAVATIERPGSALADLEITADHTALAVLNKSEIDQQITTAKRYPRSLKKFLSEATSAATIDEDTAASMFYALPRSGKTIEGPSVRLAEIAGSCYENLRYGARIVAVEDRFVVAQGMCYDLQRNVACCMEVRRRITDKHNRRYNDDMIQVTANAACAIALRQAIFKVIPGCFIKSIYQAARATAIGDAKTLTRKRDDMVAYFAKMGVSAEQLCRTLERPSVEDMTLDDLGTLRGLATAIKDGDTTVDDVFGQPPLAEKKPKRSALNDPPKTGNGQAAEASTARADSLHAEDAPHGASVAVAEPPAPPAKKGPKVSLSAIQRAIHGATTVGQVEALEATYLADDRYTEPERAKIGELAQDRTINLES